MNILLSGPPFAGKTTIGTELAHLLDWQLINTDSLLEEKYGISCSEQFKLFGNQKFREHEFEVLQKFQKNSQKQVISLGGGTLTHEPNALIIKSLGPLFFLQCSFEELYSRLLKTGRKPAYLDPDNLEGSFREFLKGREPHYFKYADFIVDVSQPTPLESALKIIQLYENLGKTQS